MTIMMVITMMTTMLPASAGLSARTPTMCLLRAVQGFQKDFDKYGEKSAQIVGVSVDSVDKVSFCVVSETVNILCIIVGVRTPHLSWKKTVVVS